MKTQTLNSGKRNWVCDPPLTREERLLEALKTLVDDGECYCTDNIAAKGPCGWCVARDLISKAKG